jgi:hypothetical protein
MPPPSCNLFAMTAQHRLVQPGLGHQLQQRSRRGVDRQSIDQLDGHDTARRWLSGSTVCWQRPAGLVKIRATG